MPRRTRRLPHAVASLTVVLLLVVACSASGFPTGYDDQVDEDTGLSNVESNWLEGCEVSLSEDLAQNANDICACSYARIKSDIAFDDFVLVNDELKSDPTSLLRLADNSEFKAREIVDIVSTCIADS